MKKYSLLILVFLLGTAASVKTEESRSQQDILKKIYDTAKQNDRISEIYGLYQQNITRKLSDEGKLKKQETRVFRTIWVNDTPYAELIQIDGHPLTKDQKEEEEDRKKKFVKRLKEKKTDQDDDYFDMTWQDLNQKYTFTSLPAEGPAVYTFDFIPKGGKQQERNRIEKVFNHLSGRLWADKDFNLLRAEGRLQDEVKFGWGILAKVEELQLQYSQQAFQNVWLPASLHVAFEAKIALLKTERQEIQMRFYDPFRRPEAGSSASSTP
jgi:hypothetical protein